MRTVHLIDTPRRTALAAHSTALRTTLKDWEKAFAASHSGQKPGKEDIKACLEIAKTYKEYNRVRDVLAGKLGVENLDDAARRSPTARKGGRRKDDAGGPSSDTDALRDVVPTFTPYKAQDAPHPNLLDPYDPPTCASPRPYLVTAIGPTPHRDGKVLGLFDLLSNSGNGSQATTSTRKRKFDGLANGAQLDIAVGNEQVVAQTPSRKRTRKGVADGDILDHPADNTPKGYQRHSRTPASEGKKFMLSHFFATPSTMRFAAIAEDQEESHHGQEMDQGTNSQQTPLRTHVLDGRAKGAAETERPALDATPSYLKRSYSFKDRLLSISTLANGTTNSQKTNLSNPTFFQNGPPTLRRYKSGPKPLSEIVRGLRQMDDERHDDDLDALHEMEGGQINVLVGDSQAPAVGTGAEGEGIGHELAAGEEPEAPTRVWKKKGQKRTTRRASMRPVKMKPKKENQWVAEDNGSDNGDGSEVAEETQHAPQRTTAALGDGEDNILGNDLPTPMDKATGLDKQSESGSGAEFEAESDRDELDNYGEPTESKAGGKRVRNDDLEAEAAKPTRKKGKNKEKDTADKAKQKKGPTINPNALSHQNFRSLKIRNKNSKAKGGRGRFARKGR
jgi:hypothetical protein